MLALFSKIFSIVSALPWKDVFAALGKLFSEQKWVVILSTAFLIGGIVSTVQYWQRGAQLEGLITDSLQARLEETPQQHKGLEAFLMTSLNQQVREHSTKPILESVESAELSSAFTDRFNQFLQKFHEMSIDNCEVNLAVAQGYGSEVVFTDDSPIGFLFAPLRLFRPSYPDQQLFDALTRNRPPCPGTAEPIQRFIEGALAKDPMLKEDICVSRKLAWEIHQFTEISILDKTSLDRAAVEFLVITPRQTYLISRNGLNRILLRSPKGAQSYYASQFRATTFFPSRPYFWPAFSPNTVVTSEDQKITTPRRAGAFFHVTQPYMDLGGNGIVITLSKGFRLPYRANDKEFQTEFALCFDLAFEADAGLQTSLKRSVKKFDGEFAEVTCRLHDNSPACASNTVGKAESSKEVELREALAKALRGAVKEGEQDKVFGNILVLPPLRASEGGSEVLASIPVGRVSIDQADKSAEFLVAEFDFLRYRSATAFWGLAAAFCFFLAFSVLGFFLTRTVLRTREFGEALKSINSVMEDAPTPFVWLDSNDHVSGANKAFWKLTGETPSHEFTLRSIISPGVQDVYDKAQQNRRLGKPVAPYDILVRRPDGTETAVRVHSMDVPSLRPQRGRLPETFGVFLSA